MSVLLNSNVASELMRKSPSPNVANWIKGLQAERSYLSMISEAELRYGAAILVKGK